LMRRIQKLPSFSPWHQNITDTRIEYHMKKELPFLPHLTTLFEEFTESLSLTEVRDPRKRCTSRP
jgi:hypothetical protein